MSVHRSLVGLLVAALLSCGCGTSTLAPAPSASPSRVTAATPPPVPAPSQRVVSTPPHPAKAADLPGTSTTLYGTIREISLPSRQITITLGRSASNAAGGASPAADQTLAVGPDVRIDHFEVGMTCDFYLDSKRTVIALGFEHGPVKDPMVRPKGPTGNGRDPTDASPAPSGL